MKKKVLCIFSLILYILVACTFLSGKIETEMLTQTEVQTTNAKGSSGQTIKLSLRVLFTDTEGDHLYEVIDGTGWESGLRIREIPSSLWSIDPVFSTVNISGGKDYRFVLSASRQPQPGELAEILGKSQKADDRYLAIYTRAVPEEITLPTTAEIIAQSSNALLLNMTDAVTPFQQHRAKTMTVTTDMANRIFSLTDVVQFLEALPLVALLVTLLLAPVLIWLYSCLLAGNASENKAFLLANIGVVIGLLCCAIGVMNMIDLPASLLPASNILEFSYYSSEFSMVFQALHDLGDVAPEIVGMLGEVKQSILGNVAKGLLLPLAVILAETLLIWCRWYAQSKKNRAGSAKEL